MAALVHRYWKVVAAASTWSKGGKRGMVILQATLVLNYNRVSKGSSLASLRVIVRRHRVSVEEMRRMNRRRYTKYSDFTS